MMNAEMSVSSQTKVNYISLLGNLNRASFPKDDCSFPIAAQQSKRQSEIYSDAKKVYSDFRKGKSIVKADLEAAVQNLSVARISSELLVLTENMRL